MLKLLFLAFTLISTHSYAQNKPQFKNQDFRFRTIGGNGHALNWDGAFVITGGGHQGIESWRISAIRPQEFRLVRNFSGNYEMSSNALSRGFYFGFGRDSNPNDNLVRSGHIFSKIGSPNAVGITKDFAVPNQPYRSNSIGLPQSNGSYRSYQVKVYASDAGPGGAAEIGVFTLRVVIRNHGTAQSEIEKVEVLQDFQELSTTNGSRIRGIEPTLTFDDRLMIFHLNDRLQYSFNPNPNNINGWSPQESINRLYDRRNQMVSSPTGGPDVRFGDLYKISNYRLRYADGSLIGDRIIGAYPWINLDGDDLFITTVLNNRTSAVRAGQAVVGHSTRGLLRHLDGGPNDDRYTSARLFVSSFGKLNGGWAPKGMSKELPLSRKPDTMPIFTSNDQAYYEVSFYETLSGNFDFYLTMNESLRLSSRAFDYLSDRSQDISGHFHEATLRNGALFTDDYIGCSEDEFDCIDRDDTYSGKAVYLKAESSIFVPAVSNGHSILSSGNGLTAMLAIKPLTESGVYNVMRVGGTFSIIQNNSRRLDVTVNGVKEHDVTPILPRNTWSHIAVTYIEDQRTIKVFLNGNQVSERQINVNSLDRESSSQGVVVGPNKNASTQSAVMAVDQVALSSKVLSLEEISYELNGQLHSEPSIPNLNLPNGLESKEIKVFDALNSNQVELGRHLFFDRNLSIDKSTSCASCHQSSQTYTDGLDVARGLGGQRLARNTPAILNMRFYSNFFHDGRAQSLEELSESVLSNPREFNTDFNALESYINSQSIYDSLFRNANLPKTRNSVFKALSQFVLSLTSADSKVDRVASGTVQFTPAELRGEQVFNGAGRCVECHSGSIFSDGETHNIGIVSSQDLGQFEQTKKESDRFKFKTPSLRNVARTAPYFHNGSAQSLEEVVELYNTAVPRNNGEMDSFIKPLGLNDQQKSDLVAYLRALSGSVPNVTPPSTLPPVDNSSRSCSLDGAFVTHGDSRFFYRTENSNDCNAERIQRTCNDGSLSGETIYRFSSCSAPVVAPPTSPELIRKGELILRSYEEGSNFINLGPEQNYTLVMQGDGNLVLYRGQGEAIWATGTGASNCQYGCFFVFQGDGNAVLYSHTDSSRSGAQPYWASDTTGGNAAEYIRFNREREVIELLRADLSLIKDMSTPPVNPQPPTEPTPTPDPPQNCSLDGVQVSHGSSRSFYDVSESANCSSRSQSRTCNDGVLSGSASFRFASCSAPEPQPEPPSNYKNQISKDEGFLLRSYENNSILVGSSSQEFLLRLNRDGNLVLLENSSAIWSTGTGGQNGSNKYCRYGCFFAFQSDGNLVLYSFTNVSRTDAKPYWASDTGGGNASQTMRFNNQTKRFELFRSNNSKIKDLSGTLKQTSYFDSLPYFPIDGNPVEPSPTPEPPRSCSQDGVEVDHGASKFFYDLQESANCISRRQNRTCNNGSLSGSSSFRFASCSAPQTPIHDSVTKGSLILRSYDSGSRVVNFGEGESHFLAMQGDGNLVLYRSNGQPVWASNTGLQNGQNKYCQFGCFFSFQSDGNLVLYSHTNSSRSQSRPYWATNTGGSNATETMRFNNQTERLELFRADDSKIKELSGTNIY